MPLNLPDKLPAISLLEQENIFVIGSTRATTQDIRPLKIVILNLMPIKITTETDLIRLLSNSPLQIEVSFMKLKSHTSKNTPIEHMMAFYRDFELMRNEKFDGMIVTGAPVEHLEFEDVNYWDEISDIFTWARTHVTSTLDICWAAQAGLYFHYGVPKHGLDQKMFGIFKHHVCTGFSHLPIFRGFDDEFYVPHSRHTEVRREDIERCKDLQIVSESEESGVHIVMARGGREIFVTGHSEYSPYTLDTEYRRDLGKGLPIALPKNYYRDDCPEKGPLVRWRSTANLLFSNWLNYYVYQATPYDINTIE
ncbi:MAG: homoserine O-succinyltransferase [Bacteroidales bacterium]|nr:homoserine O-succinyltransferase [Bacteroidales bacterium]